MQKDLQTMANSAPDRFPLLRAPPQEVFQTLFKTNDGEEGVFQLLWELRHEDSSSSWIPTAKQLWDYLAKSADTAPSSQVPQQELDVWCRSVCLLVKTKYETFHRKFLRNRALPALRMAFRRCCAAQNWQTQLEIKNLEEIAEEAAAENVLDLAKYPFYKDYLIDRAEQLKYVLLADGVQDPLKVIEDFPAKVSVKQKHLLSSQPPGAAQRVSTPPERRRQASGSSSSSPELANRRRPTRRGRSSSPDRNSSSSPQLRRKAPHSSSPSPEPPKRQPTRRRTKAKTATQ